MPCKSIDVVSLLLEGANVNLKDKNNNSAEDFDYKPPSPERVVVEESGTISPDLSQDEL